MSTWQVGENSINQPLYLQYKYGYDSQTSSVFEHSCKKTHKDVTFLHYSSNIVFKKAHNLMHRTYFFVFIMRTNKSITYCFPAASFLASFCRTSISIIAASLYFFTERTILIATISLLSRSQHSSTWPKVPKQIKRYQILQEVFLSHLHHKNNMILQWYSRTGLLRVREYRHTYLVNR